MRGRARKDSNHNLIVDAINKYGGCVLDLYKHGRGVPDLIVKTKNDGIQLAEIKNPENAYGRKGLSNLQNKWATNWRGGPVYIIRTIEDAFALVNGQFSKLESVTADKQEGQNV